VYAGYAGRYSPANITKCKIINSKESKASCYQCFYWKYSWPGKSRSHVSLYRSRLIEARVIHPIGRGKPEFAIPGIKDYLKKIQ